MEPRDAVALARDCVVTEIPSGIKMRLQAGDKVIPQHVQGGNVTVMTEYGGLVRVFAADADALGAKYAELAAKATEERAARAGGAFDVKDVWEELKAVYDPEIPVDIVNLGLVYEVASEPGEGGEKVLVVMTLTAPGCGVGAMLVEDVRRAALRAPGVASVEVQLVFDPPWDQSRMSEAARLELGFM